MSCLHPQHRFQPQNPLSAAQPFSPREVGGEEEELRLSAHTLLLPTRGQLEARMMVTAFELGLDNITDDAVSSMIYAVEVCSNFPSVLTRVAFIYSRQSHRWQICLKGIYLLSMWCMLPSIRVWQYDKLTQTSHRGKSKLTRSLSVSQHWCVLHPHREITQQNGGSNFSLAICNLTSTQSLTDSLLPWRSSLAWLTVLIYFSTT